VINVYNPSPTAPRSRTPSRLQEVSKALERCASRGSAPILLGDFNLHPPAWGGPQSGADDLAEELLTVTASFGLELLLPQGEITWQRGRSATKIDLVFATTGAPGPPDRMLSSARMGSPPGPYPDPKHHGSQD
jgi:hypothetical protein